MARNSPRQASHAAPPGPRPRVRGTCRRISYQLARRLASTHRCSPHAYPHSWSWAVRGGLGGARPRHRCHGWRRQVLRARLAGSVGRGGLTGPPLPGSIYSFAACFSVLLQPAIPRRSTAITCRKARWKALATSLPAAALEAQQYTVHRNSPFVGRRRSQK